MTKKATINFPQKRDVYIKCSFKPFDKVLVRNTNITWGAAFFSHIEIDAIFPYVTTGGFCYEQCIPYNKDNMHLLGTNNNP